jgi:hypothetical protein
MSFGATMFAVWLTLFFWPFAALIRVTYYPIFRRCCGRRCLWVVNNNTTTMNINTSATSTSPSSSSSSTSSTTGDVTSSSSSSGPRIHVTKLERLPAPSNDVIRIVCISDTHGYHRLLDVPNGDILLHSGDMLLANKNADNKAYRMLADVNSWLTSLPHQYKCIIAGNHDGAVRVLYLTYTYHTIPYQTIAPYQVYHYTECMTQ